MLRLVLILLDIICTMAVIGFLLTLLWSLAAPWETAPAPAASGVHNLNLQVPAQRHGVVGLI